MSKEKQIAANAFSVELTPEDAHLIFTAFNELCAKPEYKTGSDKLGSVHKLLRKIKG